ncbi:MAG: hypothetical protein KAY77_00365, partial [Oscillospiraceae bacterium]|nr:hypothetical protein [Oscillospiraceae bacterium]
VLGGCKLDPALVGADTVPRAPGMKYKHYAPKAPLTLLEGDAASTSGTCVWPKSRMSAFISSARYCAWRSPVFTPNVCPCAMSTR